MPLEPLSLTVGQPLRVAVYNSISRAIRNGTYPLGSVLPSDAEFCAALGVSRPVVREAMLLLEEDRLISTRRGIGRFVSDAIPRIGFERVRGLELLLSESVGAITVGRVSHEVQPASDLLSQALALDPSAAVWTWESVLRRTGTELALTFEAVPAAGSAFSDPATDSMPEATALTRLLASVLRIEHLRCFRGRPRRSPCRCARRRPRYERADPHAACFLPRRGSPFCQECRPA